MFIEDAFSSKFWYPFSPRQNIGHWCLLWNASWKIFLPIVNNIYLKIWIPVFNSYFKFALKKQYWISFHQPCLGCAHNLWVCNLVCLVYSPFGPKPIILVNFSLVKPIIKLSTIFDNLFEYWKTVQFWLMLKRYIV